MTLTSQQILAHPSCHNEMRLHARALLDTYKEYPRISTVFATEQRQMMGSIALSLYFTSASGSDDRGIVLARFLDTVVARGVASRNTGDRFIKEMVQYGYLRRSPKAGDRRVQPLEPTETTILVLLTWAMVHLKSLDNFDGGKRAATIAEAPDLLTRLQPRVTGYLVGEGGHAEYSQTLAIFAWINNGKLIILRILAGMGDVEPGSSKVSTDVTSIAELSGCLNISRTHLTRKLREVEAIGSIGWDGDRGRSPMWISTGFLKEMKDEAAERLASFDAAFSAIFAEGVDTQT